MKNKFFKLRVLLSSLKLGILLTQNHKTSRKEDTFSPIGKMVIIMKNLKKTALLMLSLSIIGTLTILAGNIIRGETYGLELALTFISFVYLASLQSIPEEKLGKYQCVPAFLMFYLSAARIVYEYFFEFGDAVGVISLIPVAVGLIYTIVKMISAYREMFRNLNSHK